MSGKPFTKLKAFRAERNLTQEAMAKHLGMDVNTYRRKENGDREFKLSEVAKAQEIFGIDPQEYFFYHFSNQSVTNVDNKVSGM